MARSGVARRLGAGKARMGKDWYGNSQNSTVAPGTPIPGWLVLPTILHPMQDPTLLFTDIAIAFATTANVASGAVFGLGIYLHPYVTTSGVAVDTLPAVAGLQDPLADPDTDWIYKFVAPEVVAAAAGGTFGTNRTSRDLQISRAMRRLGNNMAPLVVVTASVNTFNYHWHGRALLGER